MDTLLVTFFAVEQESHNNIDLLNNQIHLLQHSIQDIDFSCITVPKYDKEEIRKQLISICDKNEDNIIILTGNYTVFSMLIDIANEIIDNDILNEINILISKLTKELQHSFNRLLCGIRHQTLIITMCDFYPNITLIFKKYHAFIRATIDSMAEIHERSAFKSNDNFDNSEKFRNNSSDSDMSLLDESDEEMKEMLVMTKFYKKPEQNVRVSVEQALDLIKGITLENDNYKVNIQTVNTIDAYNRILAKDVFTMMDMPSCRTSAKHGYAMLVSNEADGKDIRKVLKVSPKISVVPGICVRVRSGDPIPNGANTVVTPENIKILDECNDNDDDYFNIDDKEYEIEVLIAPKINENIRNTGYLVKRNGCILKKLIRIGSSEQGILALCGCDTISVIEISSIGVLSIGSTFEEAGNTLPLGRIYDSNRIILTSLLKENGYNLMNLGISAYQLDAIIKKIKDALNKVDVLVIMGPVNDKDILKTILTEYFSVDIHFGHLDMKPGKSTTFATCVINDKLKFFLCMSANPATVPIVAHVLLLPLLNMMHCNCFTPIVMQTCIKNHELHLRPKFSWTTAQWAEEMFPRAYCSKNQHQNIMKYQKTNALLRLLKYTSEMPKLDAAFVPAEFFG